MQLSKRSSRRLREKLKKEKFKKISSKKPLESSNPTLSQPSLDPQVQVKQHCLTYFLVDYCQKIWEFTENSESMAHKPTISMNSKTTSDTSCKRIICFLLSHLLKLLNSSLTSDWAIKVKKKRSILSTKLSNSWDLADAKTLMLETTESEVFQEERKRELLSV